mmetsp:Transcript_19229/g.55937  ORF Transcript_19229/g.55937 Transcript_19229/m.55937 type:complete len:213 (+) Transcript_19229:308-946(+)
MNSSSCAASTTSGPGPSRTSCRMRPWANPRNGPGAPRGTNLTLSSPSSPMASSQRAWKTSTTSLCGEWCPAPTSWSSRLATVRATCSNSASTNRSVGSSAPTARVGSPAASARGASNMSTHPRPSRSGPSQPPPPRARDGPRKDSPSGSSPSCLRRRRSRASRTPPGARTPSPSPGACGCRSKSATSGYPPRRRGSAPRPWVGAAPTTRPTT